MRVAYQRRGEAPGSRADQLLARVGTAGQHGLGHRAGEGRHLIHERPPAGGEPSVEIAMQEEVQEAARLPPQPPETPPPARGEETRRPPGGAEARGPPPPPRPPRPPAFPGPAPREHHGPGTA